MQPFPPETMMVRAESSKARRLLRKQDVVHGESELNRALPKAEQKDFDLFSQRHKVLSAELDALCATVWKREVGLERYTVLHARRGDFESRFQVLSFSVSDNRRWSDQWMWSLYGRALRKDETLGFKDGSIGFRQACLMRRHLDGAWRELRWQSEATE